MTMSMSDPGDVVSAFIAAIEAKDLDTAMALVTDDVSYENVPMSPIVGRDAVRSALERFLAMAAAVDWQVSRQLVSANAVANERLDRFQIGDGWLEMPVAGFFEVTDDGRISLWRDYFDLPTYTTQLAALLATD
jgi:limonene-1,2-epoxide hydrolase